MRWWSIGLVCLAAALPAAPGMAQGSEQANASGASPENSAPRLMVQTGHGGQINALAFSPDGKHLLSGSDDKTAKLWDIATGREIRTFGGHESQVLAVAFSPDGKTIATGSWDHTLIVRDARTGQALHVLNEGSWVQALAFSPDGRLLATGTRGGRAIVWEVASGKALFRFTEHARNVTSVAFSPDGRVLASVSLDGTLGLMDVASGQVLGRYRVPAADGLTSVLFMPDNKTVAIASLDHGIHILDTQAAKVLRVLKGHTGGVHALVLPRDGEVLLSIGSDKMIRRWDVASGKLLGGIQVPDYAIGDFGVRESAEASQSLAVSPDGNGLAWAESDEVTVHAPKLRRTPDGLESRLTGVADEIRRVQAFDNRLEAHGSNSQLAMWQVDAGKLVGRLEADAMPLRERETSFAISPNERIGMAWGLRSGAVRLWNNESGEVLPSLPVRCADAIAVTPDGALAATVGGCPMVFEVKEGRLAESALGPDGKAANDSMDKKDIWLWDTASGRALGMLRGHFMSASALAFSPDGKLLASGGSDQTIRLWDAATRQQLALLREREAHGSWVDAIAFAPDGKTLAAGTRDSLVELWDVASGTLRMTLRGHLSGVHSLTFSPDGQFLISAGEDKSVRYWRVADGAWLASLYSFNDGTWAVTDPDGRFDAADLEEIHDLHWVMPDDPMTPVPLEAFMREYYEPRLLARILGGEVFKPVRAVATLNRVQPEVRITGVKAVAGRPGFVNVSVEAQGARRSESKSAQATAVHDLRLFRNGQLVGYRDGKLTGAGKVPYRQTFRVRLGAGDNVSFSAYAFNDDGIKSATAQQDYAVPAAAAVAAQKPRAWIVTIGVNRHENPAWNLEYAANDANRLRESLIARLRQQGSYRDIVAVSLISDAATPGLAARRKLKAVFDRLAGRPADVRGILGAERLGRVLPDDLLIVSFSGHGIGHDGRFYLIPADTGPGERRAVTPELLAHAISSEELAGWLRDVDGGDIAMVIDACQSAASVGSDFKPGPMGARGLGQMAYEKGMRLLVASQAEQFAQESSLTQQGLLSYALVNDGLEHGRADFHPADGRIMLADWLNFGMERVPALANEVARGRLGERGARLVGAESAVEAQRKRMLQQPALFDFTKNRRDATVAAGIVRP